MRANSEWVLFLESYCTDWLTDCSACCNSPSAACRIFFRPGGKTQILLLASHWTASWQMWTCDGCVLKLHLKRHYSWPACVTACVPSAVPVRGFMGRSLCVGTPARILPQIAELLLLINVFSLGESWVETVWLVSLQLLWVYILFFSPLFPWNLPFFPGQSS